MGGSAPVPSHALQPRSLSACTRPLAFSLLTGLSCSDPSNTPGGAHGVPEAGALWGHMVSCVPEGQHCRAPASPVTEQVTDLCGHADSPPSRPQEASRFPDCSGPSGEPLAASQWAGPQRRPSHHSGHSSELLAIVSDATSWGQGSGRWHAGQVTQHRTHRLTYQPGRAGPAPLGPCWHPSLPKARTRVRGVLAALPEQGQAHCQPPLPFIH